jgi:hypothetical protein
MWAGGVLTVFRYGWNSYGNEKKTVRKRNNSCRRSISHCVTEGLPDCYKVTADRLEMKIGITLAVIKARVHFSSAIVATDNLYLQIKTFCSQHLKVSAIKR